MVSINTQIGGRFEDILQEKYPELKRLNLNENRIPDFELNDFYAEAKVSFRQADYASHLKESQIKSFKRFEKEKPVVYLMGFHNFAKSSSKLFPFTPPQREEILSREMHVPVFYIVDNIVITGIWKRRDYVNKQGHIQDCTVRESHLKQIINDSRIKVNGETHSARRYYNVPTNGWMFLMPERVEIKDISVGCILPKRSRQILQYFQNK